MCSALEIIVGGKFLLDDEIPSLLLPEAKNASTWGHISVCQGGAVWHAPD